MASKDAPERFPDYVPFPVVRSLMEDCFKLLKRQRSFGCATVADVACKEHRTGTRTKLPTVTVVGDTHGHFHDFLRLLDLAGACAGAAERVNGLSSRAKTAAQRPTGGLGPVVQNPAVGSVPLPLSSAPLYWSLLGW